MQISSWRSLFFAGAVALLTIYVVWWGRMIANPVERTSTDFISFYSAGRVARLQGFASIYNADEQQKVEQDVVGFPLVEGQVLLYNHMPYLAPLLALVMSDHYVASFVRWLLILVALYLIGTQFMIKSLFAEETPEMRLVLFAGALTFLPIFISLWQGQDTAFLYLGVVLWCVGLLKKQDWLVAAGLALVTVRPHFSIALALPLLFKNQRAWWRSVLVIGLLGLVSVLLVTIQGALGYVNRLLVSSDAAWFGMKPEAMLNLQGLLIRVVPSLDLDTASKIGWFLYLVGIVLLCILWQRSKSIDARLLGLSILIAVVTAPHIHLHDLAILIFPILFVAHERMHTESEPRWLLFPLGASLCFLIGLLLEPVYYILPYLLFILLAYLFLTPRQPLEQSPSLSTPK